MCCSVLQCVAVCCNSLQRVAACCSVLQRVAVRCSNHSAKEACTTEPLLPHTPNKCTCIALPCEQHLLRLLSLFLLRLSYDTHTHTHTHTPSQMQTHAHTHDTFYCCYRCFFCGYHRYCYRRNTTQLLWCSSYAHYTADVMHSSYDAVNMHTTQQLWYTVVLRTTGVQKRPTSGVQKRPTSLLWYTVVMHTTVVIRTTQQLSYTIAIHYTVGLLAGAVGTHTYSSCHTIISPCYYQKIMYDITNMCTCYTGAVCTHTFASLLYVENTLCYCFFCGCHSCCCCGRSVHDARRGARHVYQWFAPYIWGIFLGVQKRPTSLKRDLHHSKEIYIIPTKPMSLKIDLCDSKETYITRIADLRHTYEACHTFVWFIWIRCISWHVWIWITKETYIAQKRPV